MVSKRSELKKLMEQALRETRDFSSTYAWDQEALDYQDIEIPNDPDITAFSLLASNDPLSNSSSTTTDVGLITETAPTQKPSRPRALAIAYNSNTKVVYIVFRDNTWWQYNDVGTDVWMGLSSSSSTNDYLPTLENASSSNGPADLTGMSAAAMAQISGLAQISSRIQKS